MAVADLSWDGLVRNLAQVLPTLEERASLLLSWAVVPTVYVQFDQTATALHARTGGDDVMPSQRRLGTAGAERLRALGWTPPGEDPGAGRTWHAELAWPARSSDHERLARMCVAVLRDLHQVPGPEALEYAASREAEPAPEGVLYHREDLAPAEPHLELPTLGLRDARAG